VWMPNRPSRLGFDGGCNILSGSHDVLRHHLYTRAVTVGTQALAVLTRAAMAHLQHFANALG
jgi:hypothetical protein